MLKINRFIIALFIVLGTNAHSNESFEANYKRFTSTLFSSPEETLKQVSKYIESHSTTLKKEEKGKLLFMETRLNLMLGNMSGATESLGKYKIIVEHFNDQKRLYNFHNLSAVLFNSLGLYKLALENLLEAYSIALARQEKVFIVQIEYNIAYQYIELGFYDKAKEYVTKYYEYSKSVGDERQVVSGLSQLAIIAFNQGELDKSLALIQESISIRNKINLTFNHHSPYLLLGKIYFKLGKLSLAKENLQKAKKLLTVGVTNAELAEVNLELAKVLANENSYSAAFGLLNETVERGTEKVDATIINQVLKLKASMESQLGKYQQAYLSMMEFEKNIERSLIKQQKVAISYLLNQRDSISKENQLAQSLQEKKLIEAQAELRTSQFMLVFFSGISILIVTLFFVIKLRFKNKLLNQSIDNLDKTLETLRETQSKLLETEKMKAMTTLVSGLAHQLNTPIGIVTTSISTLQDRIMASKQSLDSKTLTAASLNEFFTFAEEAIQLANQSTSKTTGLIEKFKMISAQLEKTEIATFDLKQLAEETMQTIIMSKNKNIEVVVSGSMLLVNNFHGCWVKIISQLVDNSINHGFNEIKSPAISIMLEDLGEKASIKYKDNGKGISEEELKNIFNPFYTTKVGEGSLGLGLNIVYNAVVHMMNGNIEATTGQDGFAVQIVIPKDVTHSD